MMLRNVYLNIILTLLFFSCASTQKDIVPNPKGDSVESFTLEKYEIIVKFYDPIWYLPQLYPDYKNGGNEEILERLLDYMHNSVLYTFELSLNSNIERTYCITGNPEKQNSSKYYQIQIVNPPEIELSNPQSKKYKDRIYKTISDVPISGTLFENMQMFQTDLGKMMIKSGISATLYGKVFRNVPYEEIKKAMIKIIKENEKL